MKLTKHQIKEFIRQAIAEIREGGPGSGRPKGKGKPDSIPASEWEKMDADEREYHTSGQYDKDAERDDTGKDDKPYTDDDEDHGGWSESVKESRSKPMKTTVKEVKRWMKTLEENRYRKIVNADARRVSWLVNNNLAEDYDQMPVSMKKKWPKAQYGRERYLAREFMKSQNNKLTEQTLREMIRKVIREGFADGTMKWENKRTGNAEVLGYKLTGKQDHRVKPNKLTNQVGFKKNN